MDAIGVDLQLPADMAHLDWKWLNQQTERGVFTLPETFSTIGIFIQPTCTTSLKDTSTKILNTLYPFNVPDYQFPPNEHKDLGLLIFAIAKQVPAGHAAQARLVQLVIALSNGVTSTDLSQKWHTSGFKHQALDRISLIGLRKTNHTFTAVMSEHLKLNAFVAMLQKQNFFNGVSIAISKLRDALETDFENPGNGFSDIALVLRGRSSLRKDATSVKLFNYATRNGLIQAAGIWMALNAKQILEEVVTNPNRVTSKDSGARMLHTGRKYNGPLLGSERWSFWSKEFLEAAKGVNVD